MKKGYINCGSLNGLSKSHNTDFESSVLNCALFAQLHADKKVDRFEDIKSWFKHYIDALEKTGWLISQQKSGNIKGKFSYITMQEIITQEFESIGPGSEHAVSQLINSFNDIATNKGKSVFDTNSKLITSNINEKDDYLTTANFQMSYSYNTDNTMNMVLGCYQLETSCKCKHIFSFNIPNDESTIWQSIMVLSLNETYYQQVKVKIEDLIKDEVEKYIFELSLL